MTMTAEQCRRRADECMDLAESAPSRSDELLKMAELWLQYAAEALQEESNRIQKIAPRRLALH
jgi:hypothetical protein